MLKLSPQYPASLEADNTNPEQSSTPVPGPFGLTRINVSPWRHRRGSDTTSHRLAFQVIIGPAGPGRRVLQLESETLCDCAALLIHSASAEPTAHPPGGRPPLAPSRTLRQTILPCHGISDFRELPAVSRRCGQGHRHRATPHRFAVCRHAEARDRSPACVVTRYRILRIQACLPPV